MLLLPKVGRKTVLQVLQPLSAPPDDLTALRFAFQKAKAKNSRIPLPSTMDMEKAADQADRLLQKSAAHGIQAVGWFDESFPQRLRDMPEPPVLLYAKGNLDSLAAATPVAVVGTRQPSEHGLNIAHRLGAVFATEGLTVVSGLALGCDAAAHQGCIEAGGQTVAILAHGLQEVNPRSNRPLADRILETGGALVSEYPIGEGARKSYYVERDRLQSGLSAGVVVVETDIKGGTMHTARYCREQGRVLACFIRDKSEWLASPKAQGNQKLVQEGALPVRNTQDIEALVAHLRGPVKAEPPLPPATSGPTSQLSLFDGDETGQEG